MKPKDVENRRLKPLCADLSVRTGLIAEGYKKFCGSYCGLELNLTTSPGNR